MHKWLLVLFPLAVNAQVGEITELRGIGEVVRQDTTDSLTAELDLDIASYDDVRTGNGRLAISFLDDSVLRLTEHSKIVIDDFVFDPDPARSRLALNMASGTARFLTGALGRINKENIAIRTPTATIAIRGTDFTTTVDEIGRSLVILLPNEDGSSSGEITVETATSVVVLNQPFQATMTTVSEAAPTRPVVLSNMTLGFIDNLLIVSPPDEITEVVEEQSGTASNILDVDLLEETELDENELDEDELQDEIGRLDIDLLNVDFLTDLLDIIEVSATEKKEVAEISGVQIEGILPGFDQQNQTYTFVEGEVLTVYRSVENTFDLELDKGNAYNISVMTAGKKLDIIINGGGENAIYINQSP
jgi:hypothetical protein|tara:strand:- start:9082 stop:10164 length:1083 start_codon:yes stop_codon:yes gene_type:complete